MRRGLRTADTHGAPPARNCFHSPSWLSAPSLSAYAPVWARDCMRKIRENLLAFGGRAAMLL
jgi:hypothetical protein